MTQMVYQRGVHECFKLWWKAIGRKGVYVCAHAHQWCGDSEEKEVSGNSELCMQPSTQTLAVKNGALLKRLSIIPCAARSSATHHTLFRQCACVCVCFVLFRPEGQRRTDMLTTLVGSLILCIEGRLIHPPTFHAVPPVSAFGTKSASLGANGADPPGARAWQS